MWLLFLQSILFLCYLLVIVKLKQSICKGLCPYTPFQAPIQRRFHYLFLYYYSTKSNIFNKIVLLHALLRNNSFVSDSRTVFLYPLLRYPMWDAYTYVRLHNSQHRYLVTAHSITHLLGLTRPQITIKIHLWMRRYGPLRSDRILHVSVQFTCILMYDHQFAYMKLSVTWSGTYQYWGYY